MKNPIRTFAVALLILSLSTGFSITAFAVVADSYESDPSFGAFSRFTVSGETLSSQKRSIYPANDVDFVRVQVVSGVVYNFYSSGATDTLCYLYTDGQVKLAEDDNSGTDNNFNITYTFTYNGYCWLRITAHSSKTGDYVLNGFFTTNPATPPPTQTAPATTPPTFSPSPEPTQEPTPSLTPEPTPTLEPTSTPQPTQTEQLPSESPTGAWNLADPSSLAIVAVVIAAFFVAIGGALHIRRKNRTNKNA